MSVAKHSLRIAGLFESELLVELMLRYWGHPLADDREFRSGLLDTATDVLKAAVAGESFFEGLPPRSMNLVSAVWYAEANTLTSERKISSTEREGRNKWLDNVRRSVPSCFCNPDLLD